MIKGMKWGGMLFASLLMASSCQNEEIITGEKQGNYSLKVSSMVDSRTYVADNGQVLWSEGDKLYVYGNNVSGVLTLNAADAGKDEGTFSGFVFGNPENLKWAVFGDEVKGTTNGAQFTISEISDPNSNSPMVGEIKGGNVDLEHLCGMVRITINNLPANANVKLVGDDIAGTAEWNGTSMSVQSTSDEIKINVANGNQTIEVPVFAEEAEATKNFKLVVNGKECPFSAPVAIGALSEKAIMHITCITDDNGNVTGFTQAATTKESLIQALQTEGTVSFQLSEDMILDKPVVVGAKTTATIDLNGKTITGTMHKKVGHVIVNEGTLNLVGGIVKSNGENGGSAVMNKGTMTIEGTTLNGAPNAGGSWPSYTINNTGSLTINDATITSVHGAVASYGEGAMVTLNNSTIDMSGIPGFTSHGIYAYDNGKVIVNSGKYENKATDQASTGGSVINGAVEINGGNFSGRIENYAGTPVIKGGTFTVNPNAKFISEGYKAIDVNGKWMVLPSNATVVTPTTINSMTFDGDNVTYTFVGDFTGEVAIRAEGSKNQTFDGSAATFDDHIKFTAGRIAGNATELLTTKCGNYTFKGFKTNNSIAFGSWAVETLKIEGCEAYMMYLNISNSKVVATGNKIIRPANANDSYKRYDNSTQKDIIQVYSDNYTLNLYNNTIKDEKGVGNNIEIYGEHGWQQNNPVWTNSITAEGNTISNVNANMPLVKIYNDLTYAPVVWPEDYVIPEATKAFAKQLKNQNVLSGGSCVVDILCRVSGGKPDKNVELNGEE